MTTDTINDMVHEIYYMKQHSFIITARNSPTYSYSCIWEVLPGKRSSVIKGCKSELVSLMFTGDSARCEARMWKTWQDLEDQLPTGCFSQQTEDKTHQRLRLETLVSLRSHLYWEQQDSRLHTYTHTHWVRKAERVQRCLESNSCHCITWGAQHFALQWRRMWFN